MKPKHHNWPCLVTDESSDAKCIYEPTALNYLKESVNLVLFKKELDENDAFIALLNLIIIIISALENIRGS